MSGTSPELKAVFTAEDRTTPVLRAIGASLRGISGASGFGRLASVGAQLAGAMGGIAQGAALATASLVGLGGAVSVAGLASLAVGTASTAAQMQALAQSSRVPIERLEVLADIARRANISQQDLGGGLGTLNERMRDASRGGSLELRQVMARLGISLRDAHGQVRNASDVLPQFAQAFSRIRDPALQAQLATALFGESGARLLPILTGGAAGLREGEARFRRYGVSIAANAGMLAEADRQFRDLRDTIVGFTTSISTAIGTELAPVLGPLAAQMADWIAANRQVIATGVAGSIREAAEAARSFFAERGLIDRLRDFAQSTRNVVASLGGLRTIMIGFGALVAAPFVAGLISVATTFGLVAATLGRLSFALLTTPLGWFLAAAAAVAYAGYEVYRNWDSIAAFFGRFGPQVREMGRLVSGLATELGRLVAEAWENSPLARFLTMLRENLEALLPIARDVAAFVQRIAGGAGTAPEASSNPAMNAPAQAERTGRFGNRAARMGGFYEEGRLGLPADPNVYIGQAGRGSIEATIRFENAPPGTRAEVAGTGIVGTPRTELGLNLRTRLP